MADKPEEQLSRRERQIMDIVYRHGSASASLVSAEMPDPPISRTTVRTLMRILEEKGHLEHFQKGKSYIYQPKKSPQKAGRSAFQRVLETFFGGSLEQALAAHLSEDNTDLSSDELARLAKLIRDARKKGR